MIVDYHGTDLALSLTIMIRIFLSSNIRIRQAIFVVLSLSLTLLGYQAQALEYKLYEKQIEGRSVLSATGYLFSGLGLSPRILPAFSDIRRPLFVVIASHGGTVEEFNNFASWITKLAQDHFTQTKLLLRVAFAKECASQCASQIAFVNQLAAKGLVEAYVDTHLLIGFHGAYTGGELVEKDAELEIERLEGLGVSKAWLETNRSLFFVPHITDMAFMSVQNLKGAGFVDQMKIIDDPTIFAAAAGLGSAGNYMSWTPSTQGRYEFFEI